MVQYKFLRVKFLVLYVEFQTEPKLGLMKNNIWVLKMVPLELLMLTSLRV